MNEHNKKKQIHSTNLISILFGKIANINFLTPIQNIINKAYIKYFNIDMGEFKDYKSYRSLNKLFTRSLINQRYISKEKNSFLSPCDGTCFESGLAKDFVAFSIKEHTYNIKELLGITFNDEKKELSYVNLYLSPKNYHHYHAPCDMEILECFYIPAKLYSVAKKYLIKIPNLYCQNERVILKCKLENRGILWMVFVGALNVGKMKFDFDKRIDTNAHLMKQILYKYNNLFIKKGQHLGNFELGSTIVLIAENEFISFDIKENQEVKFAENIGSLTLL